MPLFYVKSRVLYIISNCELASNASQATKAPSSKSVRSQLAMRETNAAAVVSSMMGAPDGLKVNFFIKLKVEIIQSNNVWKSVEMHGLVSEEVSFVYFLLTSYEDISVPYSQ